MVFKKLNRIERSKLIDILNIKIFGNDWALKEVEQAIAYCNPEHYEIMLDYREYKIPGSMIASIHNMSVFLAKDNEMYAAFGCLFNSIIYCPERYRKMKYLSLGEALYFSLALQWYAQKAKSLPPNNHIYDRKTTSLYTPFFKLGCKKEGFIFWGYVGGMHGRLSKPLYTNTETESQSNI